VWKRLAMNAQGGGGGFRGIKVDPSYKILTIRLNKNAIKPSIPSKKKWQMHHGWTFPLGFQLVRIFSRLWL